MLNSLFSFEYTVHRIHLRAFLDILTLGASSAMKIVPTGATVFPNVASVQKNLLKLKTMMTALSKADIHRLKSADKPAPKVRRSKSAPSKMPNAAALTLRNVTVRRQRGPAKRDRGQPPSRVPNGIPSEEAAEAASKRGTRRQSNTVDVVPALNIGLKRSKS